jgi:hypothetical protein
MEKTFDIYLLNELKMTFTELPEIVVRVSSNELILLYVLMGTLSI